MNMCRTIKWDWYWFTYQPENVMQSLKVSKYMLIGYQIVCQRYTCTTCGNCRTVFEFLWMWMWNLPLLVNVKVKCSRYRPGVAQRVGRGIALFFHDHGTRRGWVVSSMPRPHFTPGKDPVPILQEAGWAPGLVWMGRKSRSYRDSILDRPGHSQSLYRLIYPAHPSFAGSLQIMRYGPIHMNLTWRSDSDVNGVTSDHHICGNINRKRVSWKPYSMWIMITRAFVLHMLLFLAWQ